MTPAERLAVGWAIDDDTGNSSMAIWCHMMGFETGGDHPWDPSDLGRCIRLLTLPFAAGWRERLPEMAAYGPVWAALAADWSSLEKLYERESKHADGMAPKLYARMRRLIDGAQKAAEAVQP